MAILVTGGLGYIGSHTTIELIEAGYEVIIVDNLYNSQPEVLERLESITGQSITFYEADINDREAMRQIFTNHPDIDGVIHFAAYKAVGESVAKPLMYYHNNIEGTVALLQVMDEFDVKTIVYSSSATVYGSESPSPLKESYPTLDSSNPYGYTKVVCERILKDLQHAEPSWSPMILRYFNPIGAHESGQIGEDPTGIPNNLMPYIAQVAVGKLDHLNVFGDDYNTPDGTGVRDYIHVVDLAKGHVVALKQALESPALRVYNLGTGEGYSVLDLVHAFERVNGIEIPYQIGPRRPGDVDTTFSDPTKAREELGWKAEKNLDDMMRDTWRWQSQNPNGYNK